MCLAAMAHPAFAAGKNKQSNTTICLKNKKAACQSNLKSNRGQQYRLGLPKSNKDGRTHRRIKPSK
ncbi:hypothetical protein C0081_15735 [Cohaesibacter celericrescens]|jgi:hypothetical protein|uniref:Uncharacterized protein n=2 Tax=Cohaesibacter celericrescens TaxID=2067669 RepID=A0A2N5XPI3_9HYPH|nr:hypothetical protein C0081_15735 [Cohaesibacter celericrescens]